MAQLILGARACIFQHALQHTQTTQHCCSLLHTHCMPVQLPHLQSAAPCEGHAPTKWCGGRALQVPPPLKKTTAPQPACFATASNLPCRCRCFLSLECLPALHTTRVLACKAALQWTCGHMHMTARFVRTPITSCKHVSVHCHVGRQTMPRPDAHLAHLGSCILVGTLLLERLKGVCAGALACRTSNSCLRASTTRCCTSIAKLYVSSRMADAHARQLPAL